MFHLLAKQIKIEDLTIYLDRYNESFPINPSKQMVPPPTTITSQTTIQSPEITTNQNNNNNNINNAHQSAIIQKLSLECRLFMYKIPPPYAHKSPPCRLDISFHQGWCLNLVSFFDYYLFLL